MPEMVQTQNIAGCNAGNLHKELILTSFVAKIDYLNTDELENGTVNIDLCVTEALTGAEQTEYAAALAAHTP